MHDGGGGGGGGGFSGGGHGGAGGGHHGGHSGGGHYSAGGHHGHVRADGLSDAADAADPEFPDRFRPRSLRRGTPGYRYLRVATRLVVLALMAYWIYTATH